MGILKITLNKRRQSWREPARRRGFTVRCVLQTRTKKSKSARPASLGTSYVYLVYDKNVQPLKQQVWCAKFHPPLLHSQCVRYNITLLSFRPLCFGHHAVFGLFSWSTQLLAFISCHFAPKPTWTSLSESHFVLSFLVSERSGRRNPPAERSALT